MLNRYRDVFASLHSNNCRYVVLGGVAAVLYGVPRMAFEEAWRQRNTLVFETVPFYLVSLDDLIKSKTAAGRPVDLADVEQLKLKT